MGLIDSQEKRDWTLVSAWSIGWASLFPLKFSYATDKLLRDWGKTNALDGQNPVKDNHRKVDQPNTCIRTCATKKVQRILVITDSSLRSNEAPIYHPVSLERFAACWGPHSQYQEEATKPSKDIGLPLTSTLSHRVEWGCNKKTPKCQYTLVKFLSIVNLENKDI